MKCVKSKTQENKDKNGYEKGYCISINLGNSHFRRDIYKKKTIENCS